MRAPARQASLWGDTQALDVMVTSYDRAENFTVFATQNASFPYPSTQQEASPFEAKCNNATINQKCLLTLHASDVGIVNASVRLARCAAAHRQPAVVGTRS